MAYFTPEQEKNLAAGKNVFGNDYNTITAEKLNQEPNLDLPPKPVEQNYNAIISSIPTVESILNTEPTQTETEQEDMTSQYLKALESYGRKTTARLKAEETAGLPTYNKELADVNAQLQSLQKEALAIPLQIQEEFKGRGATAAGIAPIQSDRIRQNTIKALGLSAIAQTLQGNIANAQAQADKAVELEFAPIQAKIDYLKEALRLNEGKLTKEEAKQAKLQEIKLNERQALLDQQKEDKKTILSTAQEAAQNGADALTIQNIQNAKSPIEAISIASKAGVYKKAGEQFTLSPGQVRYDSNGNIIAQAEENQLDLAKFELDKIKAQADIDKIYNDIKLSGDPNSLENQKKLLEVKKLQQDINTQQAKVDAQKISQGQASVVLDEKIKLIDGLIADTSKYGDSVVGTNRFSRSTWLNPFSKLDTLTGKAQNFLGSVDQLVSKETIDTLVNLKARGGTLGALSDQERIMLQNAATKIGKWAIRDENGNVIGYNIDEKSFKKELENIKSLAETAKQNAGGSSYNTLDDFLLNATDEQIDAADALKHKYGDLSDDDLLELINQQSFNGVGGDTNEAVNKALNVPDGEEGGQCGRFVNKYTGLGLGDSYQSKIAKMDRSITYPEPGMVFVMPYGSTGHTGFIQSVNNDGTVTVKDSNWLNKSKPETVTTHKIAINKITGLRRV